jgi:ketosteroid isomerase-like protein
VSASANLDLVRSIFAAWERGDWTSAEWAHSQIEFAFADGPNPGSSKGLAGLADGTRELLNAWEDYRVQGEEYREIDGERILVLMRASGRGKTSGLELGQMASKGAALFRVRDGKVTKLVAYFDGDRAIADLGLDPGTGAVGP